MRCPRGRQLSCSYTWEDDRDLQRGQSRTLL